MKDGLHPVIAALKRQQEIETIIADESIKLEKDGYFVVTSLEDAVNKECLSDVISNAIEDAVEFETEFKLAILIRNEKLLHLCFIDEHIRDDLAEELYMNWGINHLDDDSGGHNFFLLKSNASIYSLETVYQWTDITVLEFQNISFQNPNKYDEMLYAFSKIFPEDFTLKGVFALIYTFSSAIGASSFGVFGVSFCDLIKFSGIYVKPFIKLCSDHEQYSNKCSYTSSLLCNALQERYNTLNICDITEEYNRDENYPLVHLINQKSFDKVIILQATDINDTSFYYIQLICDKLMVNEYKKTLYEISIKDRLKKLNESGCDLELKSPIGGLVIFRDEVILIDKKSSLKKCVNYISQFISRGSCPICLELLEKERFITLKCGHCMHLGCGRQACRRNLEEVIFDSCPSCNSKIDTTWLHKTCHSRDTEDEIIIFKTTDIIENHLSITVEWRSLLKTGVVTCQLKDQLLSVEKKKQIINQLSPKDDNFSSYLNKATQMITRLWLNGSFINHFNSQELKILQNATRQLMDESFRVYFNLKELDEPHSFPVKGVAIYMKNRDDGTIALRNTGEHWKEEWKGYFLLLYKMHSSKYALVSHPLKIQEFLVNLKETISKYMGSPELAKFCGVS